MTRKKLNNTKTTNGHRIALYIRVSTEEQASNPEGSIKSQEQRLRTHVDFRNHESKFGDVVAVFVDRARSGKDTNRPELQRLLQAIRTREVTLVMVTELSRLSRSIKDFCDIWDLMRANGCEFQSLREQFDTTTAAGEMVLYTLANIAQFERRQVAERVTANLHARSARGLYNGGIVPFGYKRDETKKGYLLIDPEQADVVRAAFATYLQKKSLTAAASELNRNGYRLAKKPLGGGYRPRLGHFTIDNLHFILRNKAYIAIKCYRSNGKDLQAKAVWPPIIDELTFNRAQELLTKNYCKEKRWMKKRYPFLLSGITYCGTCGFSLPGKSATGNGGKIPYYEHGWSTKRQGCLPKKEFPCNPNRVLAKKLEPLAWEKVEQLLKDPAVAKELIESAHALHHIKDTTQERDRAKKQIAVLTQQLEALAERLAELPKTISASPIYKQMERLEQLKAAEEERLRSLDAGPGGTDEPAALVSYQAFLESLRHLAEDPEAKHERAEVVKALIHRIEVQPEGIKVHYLVGKNYIDREQASAGSRLFFAENFGSKSLKDGCGASALDRNTEFLRWILTGLVWKTRSLRRARKPRQLARPSGTKRSRGHNANGKRRKRGCGRRRCRRPCGRSVRRSRTFRKRSAWRRAAKLGFPWLAKERNSCHRFSLSFLGRSVTSSPLAFVLR
jgi:site-specific DNA recombinase